MKLDALSITLGIIMVPLGLYVAFRIAAYIRNLNRFDVPKFLPSSSDVLFAMHLAKTRRMWLYQMGHGLKYSNWNLGVLEINVNFFEKKYGFRPLFGDIILVPRKWGGYHMCAIMREDQGKHKNNITVLTTYLGVYEYSSSKTRLADNIFSLQ